jgi:hypothetical protein
LRTYAFVDLVYGGFREFDHAGGFVNFLAVNGEYLLAADPGVFKRSITARRSRK